LGVTPFTGGNQVGPTGSSAFRPGNYVIKSQAFLISAVLTFKPISFKNILARQLHSHVRDMYVVIEFDYRGHGKLHGYRSQVETFRIHQQLSLVQVHQ
jgi:hypothetical protein